MRYVPKSVQAQSGLLQALAIQSGVIDRSHVTQQRHALQQTVYLGGPCQPGTPTPLPATYEPTPHALAWEHNVKMFLNMLAAEIRTNNPYNDHSAFAHAPVLKAGWIDVPAHWQVAPGRARHDNPNLVYQFERIFSLCGGFSDKFPVLLDRQGRVLDGDCRLQALVNLQQACRFGSPERVFVLQLDI